MTQDALRQQALEHAADRVYRALIVAGMRPVYVAGEQRGIEYDAPRLRLGRLSPKEFDRAQEAVAEATGVEGYEVSLEVELHCDREWPWHEERDHCPECTYEVRFPSEEDRRW